MKTDEQIAQLIYGKHFDGVRYAAMDRLKLRKTDTQAWVFLAQAMIGLQRGDMAKQCLNRVLLLSPFAPWLQQAFAQADTVGVGRADKQVLRLLNVPEVTVSACILTRNNASTIGACVDALLHAVDEIVVVDTGSTDETVAIVEARGIPVHSFAWCDDFSKARNFALSLATSKWIISIDSDEILYREDDGKIRTVAGMFDDEIAILKILQVNRNGDSLSSVAVPRMFPKAYFAWIFPIHEEPHPNCENSGATPVATVNIRVMHDGYDSNSVNMTEKLERNIRMLRQALSHDPSNFTYLYYLGRELAFAQQYSDAAAFLEQAYANAIDGTPALPEIAERLARTYLELHRTNDAIRCLEKMTQDCPEHPNGWFLLGLLIKNTDPQKALFLFQNAKRVGDRYTGPALFDPEIAGWKAVHEIQFLQRD